MKALGTPVCVVPKRMSLVGVMPSPPPHGWSSPEMSMSGCGVPILGWTAMSAMSPMTLIEGLSGANDGSAMAGASILDVEVCVVVSVVVVLWAAGLHLQTGTA